MFLNKTVERAEARRNSDLKTLIALTHKADTIDELIKNYNLKSILDDLNLMTKLIDTLSLVYEN